MSVSNHLKVALCRGNIAVLDQKLKLLMNLDSVFHEASNYAFTSSCPIIGASIGQHFRHSLDHMELPAMALVNNDQPQFLHYDLRTRGGSSERNINESRSRIKHLLDIYSKEERRSITNHEKGSNDFPVNVHFMLSGDGNEFEFHSYITREMQFAMHHAIHHLAMVRIIAVNHLGLHNDMIPNDFGKAPSTLNFENEHKTT